MHIRFTNRISSTLRHVVSYLFLITLLCQVSFSIPNPPSSFNVSAVSDTSMTLSWALNGNPVTFEYELMGYERLGTAPPVISTIVAGTTYTISGLTSNKEYYFGMRAIDNSNPINPIYSIRVQTSDKRTMPQTFTANDVAAKAGDIISDKPKLVFTIPVGVATLNLATCRVKVDNVAVTDGTAGGYDSTTSEVVIIGGVSVEMTNITYTKKTSLAIGTYEIGVEVTDSSGVTYTISKQNLKVVDPTDPDKIISGRALFYPNPFDPIVGSLKIAYNLAADSDVKIMIVDMTGMPVYKDSKLSGANGGKAGYNEVSWDGMTELGEYLKNDVYLVLITSGGKAAAKGKLLVLKSK